MTTALLSHTTSGDTTQKLPRRFLGVGLPLTLSVLLVSTKVLWQLHTHD